MLRDLQIFHIHKLLGHSGEIDIFRHPAHEKRKIQEIMDCENIGGFSHTTRIRRWPPYLTCVVIFEN